MSIGLPIASLRIAELFADPYLFSMPLYQRPYSWTLKEAGQLLEDILDAAGVHDPTTAEPDYCFGQILLLSGVVEPTIPISGKPRVFEIVDGQQRLVTLTILACVLRDLSGDRSDAEKKDIRALIQTSADGPRGRSGPVRLELPGEQQAFFAACVLAPGACSEMPDGDSEREVEQRILQVREHFIHELMGLDDQQRADLAGYFRNNCYVWVVMCADMDRANRMFLVLNGRGRHLSRHDILKAEVLSKVPKQATGTAAAAWDKVADKLGEDRFESFFSHLRTIHGHSRPQVITGIRAIISDVGGAAAFMEQVFAPLVEAYQQVLQTSAKASRGPALQISRSLAYLHRLNGAEWVPAAMVAFQQHAKAPQRLVAQLSEIERLAHLLRLLTLGVGKRSRRFSAVIKELKEGKALSSSSGACQLSRDERRTIGFHLRNLYKRNQHACKLVLLRLNDEIGGMFNDIDPSAISIEHILPQKTGDTSPWRSSFPNPQERDGLAQSLGNLLLVSPKQNQLARNQEFKGKQEIYAASRGSPLEPLTLDILNVKQWHPAEVRARESRLLQEIARVWQIELPKVTGDPAAAGDTG